MIDRIRLKCLLDTKYDELEFSEFPNLNFGSSQSTTDDIEVIEVRDYHSWQKLPSSHSGIAFHLYKDYKNDECYLFLDCSPAKALTFQNVFGSDDLIEQAYMMLHIFGTYHPSLFSHVQVEFITVQSLDLTYSIKLNTETEVFAFLDSLKEINHKNISVSRRYKSTIYLNSGSEYYNWKIYSKYHELKTTEPECLRNTAKYLIRFEATIKKKYLKQLGMPVYLKRLGKKFNAFELWNSAFSKIKESLDGCRDIKIMNNAQSIIKSKLAVTDKNGNLNYRKANAVYKTYLTIKTMGYAPTKEGGLIPKSTFNKHVKLLIDKCGYSKIFLQNLHKNDTAKIIPMTRFIELEFRDYYPPGITEDDYYDLAKA